MTQGSIWRQLIGFAIPMAVGLLFQQLYNTVDTIVVGQFVGKEALAAVGSTSSIINMLVGLSAGLSTGASVVISQCYGARDHKALHDAVHTTLSATFIMSVAGMLLGAAGYLGAAVYLHFTHSDVSCVKPLITACAVLFLFFGGVTLNRQSIRASMATHAGEANRAPREIVRRNRRIVLSFATLVTAVSLVEPIRAAANWCLAQVGAFFRWLSSLLSRGGTETATMPELGGMAMPSGETAAQVTEAAESSLFADILTYAFLGLVAAGFLWMLFDRIRALINRLSEWLEKFAGSVNEGFYDEREQLMSAEEVRENMKKRLRERVKQLFTRETPWEKLDGRGRARRLLRDFYKKRMRKASNLRARTAREAIFEGDAARADREAFADFYDEARYSAHEVDAARADQFKKDLKL